MKDSSWRDPEAVRLLREVSFFYLYKSNPSSAGGKEISDLAAEVTAVLVRAGAIPPYRGEYDPSVYQTIRRLLFFETRTFREERVLDALLKVVSAWLHQHAVSGEIARSQFAYEMERRGWLGNGTAPSAQAFEPATDETISLDFARLFFGATDRDFENASKLLTGRLRSAHTEAQASEQQGFATYRYSSRPGDVVRTFTLVSPPSDTRPYCWFRNYYSGDDGGRKISEGMVLRLERAIYFLGRVGMGEAIKLIVVPSASFSSKLLSGLLTSVSGDGEPLVGRVVLERIEVGNTEEAARLVPKIIAAARVTGSVDTRILRRLRNAVQFEVAETITSSETGEKISANALVEAVGKLCAGKFKISGLELNPASHEFYPFNQALLNYNMREKWATAGLGETE